MQKIKTWVIGLVGSVLGLGGNGSVVASNRDQVGLVEQLKSEGVILQVGEDAEIDYNRCDGGHCKGVGN